jgi:predicted glycogen debranching enzyme
VAYRALSPIDFGRAVAANRESAERREWLVTNGLGGFASGTVAGIATRRYHGLLIAALQPPVGRRLFVASLDATARYAARVYELFTNRWADGTTGPAGYEFVERFFFEGTVPVWRYALADALLEKRIWMEQNANRTYVSFTLVRGGEALQLDLDAFVNDRDFHALTTAGDWHMQIERTRRGIRVTAYDGATPFTLTADRGNVTPRHVWFRNYLYVEERARGLAAEEDRLAAATFSLTLEPGDTVTFEMGVEKALVPPAPSPLERRRAHERNVIARFEAADPARAASAPPWIRQLVLAADQFIVARPLSSDAGARSIIAGYPWFGDWGRDTMIALPGLCLATGNADVAQRILETFAHYVDGGMLPNYFPDAGDVPAYNTVDAALWYVEAVRLTLAATNDAGFLERIWPSLVAVVHAYRRGTRFAIREDPADGLISAGEPGVALTWMDAKVGDWVVTPRIGKPVEINALWLQAQTSLADFADRLGTGGARDFRAGAERTRLGLARYWNPDRSYLYDVLDGPAGADASLRPNQLFAVSLSVSAFSQAEQQAIVDVCARELQTTLGLRSLAATDARYRAHYGGSPLERDGAYHQGTVWCWLAGPLALASARAYGDPRRGLAYVEALGREIDAYGVGTLAEIADGAPPHVARGAIAQAWSVGEVLRTWLALSGPGD